MTDWRAEHDAERGLRREFSARAQKYAEALMEIIKIDSPDGRCGRIARRALTDGTTTMKAGDRT